MEKINCSFKEHKEIEGKFFCQECQIYMCNKCEDYHSKLCEHHHTHNIKETKNDIFTGICNLKNHWCEIIFFL